MCIRDSLKIGLLIAILLGGAGSVIASDLPDCPSSGYFHNCFGTYTWSNGEKYVGEWKDNKRHGQGTYTYTDGAVEEGIWKDGEFQYAQKLPANSSSSGNSKLDKHKEFCEEIGFNPGTEKFGDCIMKMMDKD